MVRGLGSGSSTSIPFALIDPEFAKRQLVHADARALHAPQRAAAGIRVGLRRRQPAGPRLGRLPCLQDREQDATAGPGIWQFLERVFQKLLLNFTWWVNRKDVAGRNVFQGGFLGLDNIGIFDRSAKLPTGGHIAQSDGTSWMAFYALLMMRIALTLAPRQPRLRASRQQILRALPAHRRRDEHARRRSGCGPRTSSITTCST